MILAWDSMGALMCGSNRPCPTPLPGKTRDITFLAGKIGDIGDVGPTQKVMAQGVGTKVDVMFRVFPGRGVGRGRFEPHIRNFYLFFLMCGSIFWCTIPPTGVPWVKINIAVMFGGSGRNYQ